MNLESAKEILELDSNFTPEQVKQNYHRLSLKHHPDKGGTSDNFIKITKAYEFITQEKVTRPSNVINLNEIFRNIIKPNLHHINKVFQRPSTNFFGFKKEILIILTPREFLEGCTKEIDQYFKLACGCEPIFCHRCKGFSINACEDCMGSGIIQNCGECTNGYITHSRKVKINIPKNSLKSIFLENTIVNLNLNNEENYLIKNDKLYYTYNITLKESLIGFTKTFKDPFDFEHTITSNSIIKQNDGYFIPNGIILLFNVVYPKKLSKSVITQLKKIDF
jgi:DnaJ-class molecular chaperone